VNHALVPWGAAAVFARSRALAAQQAPLEALFLRVHGDQLHVMGPAVPEVVEVLAPLDLHLAREVAVELDLAGVRGRAIVLLATW